MDARFPMRINQYIALCGICSRRQADRLVEAGSILVNGAKAVPGTKVLPLDEVRFADGRQITLPDRFAVFAYYKPTGIVCTHGDPHVPREQTISFVTRNILRLPVRVTYAGRLDRDSEGLLLLTNDGELAQGMMRGDNVHEKEYHVTVDKPVTQSFLYSLCSGVYLEELDVTTRPCRALADRRDGRSFTIILTQGMNRQIRRMCAAFDYRVKRILRTRVMNITLGDMRPGQVREITGDELETLYDLTLG